MSAAFTSCSGVCSTLLAWLEREPLAKIRRRVTINRRVTTVQHQSRAVNHGIDEMQEKAKIPRHKWISGVRTNATRWNNLAKQVTRNNLMKPILTPVLAKYKREHASEVVLLEHETEDDNSEDDQPLGPYSVPARQEQHRLLSMHVRIHASPIHASPT